MQLVPVVMNYPSLANVFHLSSHQQHIHSMSAVLFTNSEHQVVIRTTCNKPIVIISELLQYQPRVFPNFRLPSSNHTRAATTQQKNSIKYSIYSVIIIIIKAICNAQDPPKKVWCPHILNYYYYYFLFFRSGTKSQVFQKFKK